MDLPNLLNKLKNASDEARKFFAIEISYNTVKTAIWQSTGAHTEVVSVGSIQTCSTTNQSELIAAIDASLSDAQTAITEEPDQVIFGLPENWVDGEGLVEPKKPVLKSICRDLGLKAIGFVVTTEAMVHHLRDIEGGPPSAMLVHLSSSEVSTSLVYLGKLKSTQIVERSASIAQDVEEGIARIAHVGHLPSRMILLTETDESESIKQELISYDWQKRLEFLHIPKIETFPRDWSIKAVAVAGGREVVESLGIANLQAPVHLPQDKPIEKPSQPPENDSTPFGFSTMVIEEETPENSDESIVDQEVDPETISNIEIIPEIPEVENPKPEISRKLSLPTFRFRSKKVLLPIGLLLFFIGIGVAGIIAYRTLPHAVIDVSVAMSPFEQQLTFHVDPTVTTADINSYTLHGEKQTAKKSGSKTVPATGSKTIGDRAKGRVTLYNRTTSPKTLAAGTTLKTANLKFTLDTAVTIASASTKENADFSLTTEPSKADASVTAADIGDQYNIGKDTQLSVANFSQDNFVAVTTSSFNGGSSRKVPAVAKEDLAQLKQALVSELQNQLGQSSNQSTSSDRHLVTVGEPTITSESYSAKQGEEANEVTLDLTLEQVLYSFDTSEVTIFAQQATTQSLPQNTQMKPDTTKVSIVESSINEHDVATVKADVTILYIPRIDTTQYTAALPNTPLKEVEKRLRVIPNYLSHSVKPSWLIFGRLPINAASIDLRIKPVTQ